MRTEGHRTAAFKTVPGADPKNGILHARLLKKYVSDDHFQLPSQVGVPTAVPTGKWDMLYSVDSVSRDDSTRLQTKKRPSRKKETEESNSDRWPIGLLLEPVIGYNWPTFTQEFGSANTNYEPRDSSGATWKSQTNGLSYGAKVGVTREPFYLALLYRHSSMSNFNNKITGVEPSGRSWYAKNPPTLGPASETETGFELGYIFHAKVKNSAFIGRIWIGYDFHDSLTFSDVSLDLNSDGTQDTSGPTAHTVLDHKGTSVRIGLSFQLWEHIALNMEYVGTNLELNDQGRQLTAYGLNGLNLYSFGVVPSAYGNTSKNPGLSVFTVSLSMPFFVGPGQSPYSDSSNTQSDLRNTKSDGFGRSDRSSGSSFMH